MVKKLMSKTSIAMAIIAAFLFTMTGTVLAKEKTQPILPLFDYVSLGDSLASGQTPYGNEDSYGYTDIIADKLGEAGVLGSYGDYGVSGYTTKDVLGQFASNPKVMPSLNNAEIVTLDIGANDLLGVLRWATESDPTNPAVMLATYPGSMTPEQLMAVLTPEIGLEEKTQRILGAEMAAVQLKIGMIIQAIKDLPAPDPKIYVMGYYNALPSNPRLLPLIKELNKFIERAATTKGATYVSTQASMDKHLTKYLPGDIHPTVQGYRAIAKDFWALIQKDFLRGLN